MFESVYDSPWVSTLALAAVSVIAFALWLRRQSFLVAYVGLFTLVSLGDALRSGTWSPLHLLASSWEDTIGLAFVLLGDFRYFLLVARFTANPKSGAMERTAPKAWAIALGLTLIAALITLWLTKTYPSRFTGRPLYMAWEALVIVLVVGLRLVVLPRRLAPASAAVRAWLLEVTHFELATYALWLLADVIILVAGADAGFALRIVPNVMYYGLFVCFVAFRAPAEVRA